MFTRIKWLSCWIFLVFLVSSCAPERISVHTEYITVENLASFHVNTPDFRKTCPNLGQKLIINWSLPAEYLSYRNLSLFLKVRFRNNVEDEVVIEVKKSDGTYIYYLLNDDYFDSGGILTYKVDLNGNGCLLEEWRHQIWTDLILFDPQ